MNKDDTDLKEGEVSNTKQDFDEIPHEQVGGKHEDICCTLKKLLDAEEVQLRKFKENYPSVTFYDEKQSDDGSCMNFLKLLYEGVSFFDYSTVNLVRIEGQPVTCLSRLSNCIWVLSSLFTCTVFIYICFT